MESEDVATISVELADAALGLSERRLGSDETVGGDDGILQSLASKARMLAKQVQALGTVLPQPSQPILRKDAVPEDSSAQMRVCLRDMLRQNCASLEMLKNEIDNSSAREREHTETKALLPGKPDSQSHKLRQFLMVAKAYDGAIGIHLELSALLISANETLTSRELMTSLPKIKVEVGNIQSQLSLISNQSSMNDSIHDDARFIKSYLSITDTILSSLEPNPDAVAEDIASRLSLEDSALDRAHEHQLITRIYGMATCQFVEGNFQTAQRFLEEFLRKTSSYGDWDQSELFEARLKLAAAHTAQMNFEDAHRTLEVIERFATTRYQRSQLLQHRAEIALLSSDYHSALTYARRASTLAQDDQSSAVYYDSISLLIFLCRQLGKDIDAAVYEESLPRDFVATRMVGVLSTEQLASLVRRTEKEIERPETVVFSCLEYEEIQSPEPWSPSTEKEAVISLSSDSVEIFERPGHRPSESFSELSSEGQILELGGLIPEQTTWNPWISNPTIFSGHDGDVNSVTFSPKASRIVSGSDDRCMKIWDVESGEELRSSGAGGNIRSVAYSPHGSKIALSFKDRLWVCNLNGSKPIEVELGRYPALHISFSPCESYVAVVQGCQVFVVCANTGDILKRLEARRGVTEELELVAVYWLPFGNRLIASAKSGAIHLWDYRQGVRIFIFDVDIKIGRGYPISTTLSHDGAFIASTRRSIKKGIRIFNISSRSRFQELGSARENGSLYTSLAFTADGLRLMSCMSGPPSYICAWDVQRATCLQKIKLPYPSIRSLSVSMDGRRAVCAASQYILLFEGAADEKTKATSEQRDAGGGTEAETAQRAMSTSSRSRVSGIFQTWANRRQSR